MSRTLKELRSLTEFDNKEGKNKIITRQLHNELFRKSCLSPRFIMYTNIKLRRVTWKLNVTCKENMKVATKIILGKYPR